MRTPKPEAPDRRAAAQPRQTAAARRESILAAAVVEFAEQGLHGTATEAIARRAGVSQPYVFRLFGTKKALFLAAVATRRPWRIVVATLVLAGIAAAFG